ncbi:Hypothetical predicted protein [Pelobates cultripes]|uniref:Uncharacterized protein n=1 Tax=Pelobates cultripes TaxID=61616 RepID=A0AAD1TCE5_PELCU|nr:Hypothetical predicted protein [Pelobates cultripes]
MGKTRRQGTPGPSGNSPLRKNASLMDDFLSTPDSFRATRPADKMAAASPGVESGGDSEPSSAKGEALTQITTELAAISANMFTKRDKAAMVAELRAAIRKEILEVLRDLTALEQRVSELESENLQAIQHSQAADHATARQGSLLLDLRRQVEDLDNRGRPKKDNTRWPNEVPSFLRAMDLPPVTVRNWILDQPPPRPNHPEVSESLRNQARRAAQPTCWGGTDGPEE